MKTGDLTGKTALITGATSGIGKATAFALAERGARVLVAGRDPARGDEVVQEIRASGRAADFLNAELGDASSAKDLARCSLDATNGALDILVNNAGTSAMGPTAGFAEDAFDAVLAINVKVPFYLVSEVAPAMAERGAGSIINVVSMAANRGIPGLAVYGASKAALKLLTSSWAAEFGPHGVRVNAVSPGMVRTPPVEAMGEETLTQIGSQLPVGRVAEPEEIAAAIAFLASDQASYVQGAILTVDGGGSST